MARRLILLNLFWVWPQMIQFLLSRINLPLSSDNNSLVSNAKGSMERVYKFVEIYLMPGLCLDCWARSEHLFRYTSICLVSVYHCSAKNLWQSKLSQVAIAAVNFKWLKNAFGDEFNTRSILKKKWRQFGPQEKICFASFLLCSWFLWALSGVVYVFQMHSVCFVRLCIITTLLVFRNTIKFRK